MAALIAGSPLPTQGEALPRKRYGMARSRGHRRQMCNTACNFRIESLRHDRNGLCVVGPTGGGAMTPEMVASVVWLCLLASRGASALRGGE